MAVPNSLYAQWQRNRVHQNFSFKVKLLADEVLEFEIFQIDNGYGTWCECVYKLKDSDIAYREVPINDPLRIWRNGIIGTPISQTEIWDFINSKYSANETNCCSHFTLRS